MSLSGLIKTPPPRFLNKNIKMEYIKTKWNHIYAGSD